MQKENSAPNIFDNSMQNLFYMRQLAQFCPTSESTDNFYKSNNAIYPTNNFESNCEYIPPSPSVNIETSMNNGSNYFHKNIQQNHRFAFLMNDISSNNEYNDNSFSSFKLKYQLPNIQILRSPAKNYKPIQVISFMKK
ncbi:hypothetical protein M9Y10_031081 [Tritrichomonas musculus]|uniref:Uncharacterized protein n=1 Tax=Tritrichomonas musculus TaxID=1915356 RepID=A0ABR2H1R2_9EUKA